MYDDKNYGGSRENGRINENTDSDLNYTEGSCSDNAYQREDDRYSQKGINPEDSYGGYHESRYRGNLDGDGSSHGTADRSYIPQEPRRGHNGKGFVARRAAAVAAAGILFGCVAGGTMAGVNILSSRFTAAAEQVQEQTVAQAEQSTAAETDAGDKVVAASTGNDVILRKTGFSESSSMKFPAAVPVLLRDRMTMNF